ncbi:uncharacterized protein LOC106655809 [Trichogramma pretiosum]|uniref:uncharacterized protein LOC106655809 n=1 Tax=Trichogramma pretiosum TaxID=7493 RepID=UPI0006C997F9|nr:uncharacterized protein LOC106655809 [Trichogramma pretiosum]
MQSEIMQSFQNQNAEDLDVDVESYNQSANQSFRDFIRSKFVQFKILYKIKRKYFFIGFIIVALVIMNIINMSCLMNSAKSNSLDASNRVELIKKDDRKEARYETASIQKTVRDESSSTEMNMVTVNYKNTSIDFKNNLQGAEFNNSLLLLEGKSLWLLNLETEDHYNWHESNNYISEFYFNFKGKPIWFEDQSITIHSQTPEYDGLPLPANLKVKAIVDDSATGNSYVIDEKGKHLLVLNEYYQQSAVILSDLENAIDVKIDPLTRLIFILANGAILRCHMDVFMRLWLIHYGEVIPVK